MKTKNNSIAPPEAADGSVGVSSEQLSLLETIVILCIAAFTIIFVFAMSAAAVGDQFRLPTFLSDSVKTLWSLATTGGLAVAGSLLDSVLRKQPRTISYFRYILFAAVGIFVPIVSLMLYGKASQNAWNVPIGATRIEIVEPHPNQSFSLSYQPSTSIVGFYVTGDVAKAGGKLEGTAQGRITLINPANPLLSAGLRIAIHLCYYKQLSAAPPMVSMYLAPRIQTSSGAKVIDVPTPLPADIEIPKFNFDIEIPEMTHPEAAWLCAYLYNEKATGNNILAFVY